MSDFAFKDITEAIRNILRAEHTFNDATRNLAAQEIYSIVDHRIYSQRRDGELNDAIENDANPNVGPYVVISKPTVEREYELSGECDSCQSTVEIFSYAFSARLKTRMEEAIRQCLTSMSVTVATSGGNIFIGGCTLDDDGDVAPEDVPDGSGDYVFVYRQQFRIEHDQVVPTARN